ncbi:MAG: AraC family transcriptional regulator [Actinomycetota bacterium]|nr:AraC family transcriptional regulator [Actinomycetota bacterium]
MDALAGLLDGPRARQAFLLRAVLESPWCLRVEDEAPLCVVSVVEGRAWIMHEGAEPVALRPGDVAIVRGPEHYRMADSPTSPPRVVIHPGERCTTLSGEDVAERMQLGVRTWGDRDGDTVMLIGTYLLDGAVGRRLLDVLPRVVLVTDAEWGSPLLGLLGEEITRDQPGQEAVLDRLLDLLLIGALRVWFDRPEAGAPGWYVAQSDPVVGRALRLLQHNPAHPWTVASLASEVGLSRAALARRFAELVGEPPMSFLTEWRLTLAADLLRDPDATIGAVAQQVGYSSAFALSSAFKRVHGVSPRDHRRALVASA